MRKEGILFFCYVVLLQKYLNIFSMKTQYLCYNCQALNIYVKNKDLASIFCVGMEHGGVLLCQLLGRLPEEQWPQVGWLSSGGEELKTGIKIVQSSLRSGSVFLQGMHLPGKIHIYMSNGR